jgi:hypothetical protein
VNGDSKSTNERGTSSVGSLGLSCRYKRFLFCLGCSNRPSTNYFFHRTVVPIAQQAGQATVPGRLSTSMCLWSSYIYLCLWIHLISRVDRLRLPRPAGSSVVGGPLLPSLPPAGMATPAGVATTDRLGRLCVTLFHILMA